MRSLVPLSFALALACGEPEAVDDAGTSEVDAGRVDDAGARFDATAPDAAPLRDGGGDAGADGGTPAAMGPLARHPSNPRYFARPDGRLVYLTGSHTWDSLQDWGAGTDFDYDAYLDLLVAEGHTFIRLWSFEATSVGSATRPDALTPMPWVRSGGRFDLDALDPRYFDRLRARVEAAGARGLYVGVMLFQGWSVRNVAFDLEPWPSHPFHRDNNVNGIDGDLDRDGQGDEVHSLGDPRVLALQRAYVERVVAAVGDLDNVLWEIANESHSGSVPWQYSMIDYLRDTLGVPHPIGMTAIPGVSNDVLFDSNADWVSPSRVDPSWVDDPPAHDGDKVILLDTDHLPGVLLIGSRVAYRRWVWRSFTRGSQPLLMDAIQNPFTDLAITQPDRNQATADARAFLGDARRLADRIDLGRMTPRPDRCSTGYCLSRARTEHVVYQPGAGAFTVDLAAGRYAYEWINPRNGRSPESGEMDVAARASVSFEPPFPDDAVLHVRRTSP